MVEENRKEDAEEVEKESARHKILIIKPSSLGDIVHSLPLLKRLRDKFPDSYIAWLVFRGFEGILEGNPLIDEVIVLERRRWEGPFSLLKILGSFLRFMRSIREKKLDICIDLQGLLRSGVLTWASGAPFRMGFARGREFSHLFYNTKVFVPGTDMHAVDRYLLFGMPLGLEEASVEFPLFISETAGKRAAELLKKKQGELSIGINPIARWPTKRLPFETFAEVAKELGKTHRAVFFLLGTAGDKKTIDGLEKLIGGGAVNLAGKTDLDILPAVLSRLDLLLTNDSGTMHIADAMGVKLVAVYGPTNPARTGPYNQRNHVIQSRLKCAPCYKKKCEDTRCMLEIKAGEILAAAEGVLGEKI